MSGMFEETNTIVSHNCKTQTTAQATLQMCIDTKLISHENVVMNAPQNSNGTMLTTQLCVSQWYCPPVCRQGAIHGPAEHWFHVQTQPWQGIWMRRLHRLRRPILYFPAY